MQIVQVRIGQRVISHFNVALVSAVIAIENVVYISHGEDNPTTITTESPEAAFQLSQDFWIKSDIYVKSVSERDR